MKRDIKITVSYEQKTMEVWIDQYKHHSPLLTIDTCGYKTTDPFTLQAQNNKGLRK